MSARLVLGPVKCGDCHRFVTAVKIGHKIEWRDATPERQRTYFGRRVSLHPHKCPAEDRRHPTVELAA